MYVTPAACSNLCSNINTMTGELYKIAIGDSDLINVRFGPLCGLTPDISRGPRSAIRGPEQVQRSASKGCDYSMTSWARCWRNKGTSRPSDLAVLILTASVNLTGSWTGSSLGFAPLRMRST